MLILRAADHGLPGVTVDLAVTATLEGLEGTSTRGGELNGFPITAAHLRELLRRLGAVGLTTPEGGSLTLAITDERGRLLTTVSDAELARRAVRGCAQHPDGDCGCAVLGLPSDTDSYVPTAVQRRFVSTRDRRCRTPNCAQRAGWADHDHVVPQIGRASCRERV